MENELLMLVITFTDISWTTGRSFQLYCQNNALLSSRQILEG